jgi:hypothetical protein
MLKADSKFSLLSILSALGKPQAIISEEAANEIEGRAINSALSKKSKDLITISLPK